MVKQVLFCFLLFGFSVLQAQEIRSPLITKKIVAVQDTLQIENLSINPNRFLILDKNGTPIDSS